MWWHFWGHWLNAKEKKCFGKKKKILQAHSYIMKILELGASSPMRKNRLKQKQTNMRYICIYLSNQRKSSAALLWMTSRSGFSISHLLFSSLDERVGIFFRLQCFKWFRILPSSYRVLNLRESSQRALVNQFPCPARGIDSLPRFWNQQCTLMPTSSTHCNCIGVLLKKCAFEAITPLACFDSYLKVILEHTNWILFEGTKDTL